ncbi:hypothetical protein SEA_TWONLO_44 [Gordonia phage Twonlo]|uniref:Uncharacterized protein n=2 Tax=Dexdertvirus TaxID=2948679 RepID=A0A411CSG5_9CAUD|nr:hypothetical protein J1598_gp47 [Gordonia phage Tiamoceli]QAY16791.1 hypothetical protein SEA_TIAMOCELI_47 [Gordonia phage Tiamoceli]QOI66790.1 hypothetical protein SEA_TWONLO_44 [Gordonia phage Twonlo]WNO27348.1 hypothetical protein SEA_KWEKEL_46 [Gordonia phage Kwekel]
MSADDQNAAGIFSALDRFVTWMTDPNVTPPDGEQVEQLIALAQDLVDRRDTRRQVILALLQVDFTSSIPIASLPEVAEQLVDYITDGPAKEQENTNG